MPQQIPSFAPRLLSAVLLAVALIALPSCGRIYYDAIDDTTLATDDLLDRRIKEAADSLEQARTALLYLDDALRAFSLSAAPTARTERAHTDLTRLADLADVAGWDARRRIASVGDVAPDYAASRVPSDPDLARLASLAEALNAADASLAATLETLGAELPTLGAAPDSRRTGALRTSIASTLPILEAAHKQATSYLARSASE